MSRWILIALILFTVAGLHPAPVVATETRTIEHCWDGTRLRPVPGRWYKVAAYTQDDWRGLSSGGLGGSPVPEQLTPVPGMPQALGFASWQAMYDDMASPNGIITEVGLHYERETVGTGSTKTTFTRHPAGELLPETTITHAQPHLWIPFQWNLLAQVTQVNYSPNPAYVRFQHDPGGPILLFAMGFNGFTEDTFSLWVRM